LFSNFAAFVIKESTNGFLLVVNNVSRSLFLRKSGTSFCTILITKLVVEHCPYG